MLLQSIAAAQPIGATAPLPRRWNRLDRGERRMDADAVAQEYTDLFIGVGQCDVNLHGSHWIAGAMLDRPLATCAASSRRSDLGRRRDVVMLEDHLSALLETMRLLVVGEGDRPPASVATQRAFFERHIAPWAFLCCSAIHRIVYCQLLRVRCRIDGTIHGAGPRRTRHGVKAMRADPVSGGTMTDRIHRDPQGLPPLLRTTPTRIVADS